MKVLIGILLLWVPLAAQELGSNAIYAAGISCSPGASPKLAGTALLAQPIKDTGTYGFTVFDALPVKADSVAKTTVTTQVAAGVAQRLARFGGVTLYAPLAAGVSWTGTNTGWAWNTGVLADIPIKSGWGVMPNVRVLKSSVSDGAGYQLIFGVLARWGRVVR